MRDSEGVKRHGTYIDERQRGVDVLVAAICCAVIHKGHPALPGTIWRRGNKSAAPERAGKIRVCAQGGQGRARGSQRVQLRRFTCSASTGNHILLFLSRPAAEPAALNFVAARQPRSHSVFFPSATTSYRLSQVHDLALPLSAAHAILREDAPWMNAAQPYQPGGNLVATTYKAA